METNCKERFSVAVLPHEAKPGKKQEPSDYQKVPAEYRISGSPTIYKYNPEEQGQEERYTSMFVLEDLHKTY